MFVLIGGVLFHIMALSTQYRVRQCSKCRSNSEYFCLKCTTELCRACAEKHLLDLNTIDHNIMIYRMKNDQPSVLEFCKTHPKEIYRLYCVTCDVPLCIKHDMHTTHDVSFGIQEMCSSRRKDSIHSRIVSSEAVLNRRILLTDIKTDVETCKTKIARIQSQMLIKVNLLKRVIDSIIDDNMIDAYCNKHRTFFLKKIKSELTKKSRYIADLQKYERKYELLSKTSFACVLLCQHNCLFTKSFPMKKVLGLFNVKLTEGNKRSANNDRLLKLASDPVRLGTLNVTNVKACLHISCVALNEIYVSDKNNLILTNSNSHIQKNIDSFVEEGQSISGYGIHSVNKKHRLVYIDKTYNIRMDSNLDIEKMTISVPQCVHCSILTGDLLVGMWKPVPRTGFINRYNSKHQVIQRVGHNNAEKLFRRPLYLTENRNGDIVVSDPFCGAVVVTDRGGNHRFSYIGCLTELKPRGICTDALMNILVCNIFEHTIEILDKNGQFLSNLLTNALRVESPFSLGYNVHTHQLWVGSNEHNVVTVFRYLDRETIPKLNVVHHN